MGKCDDFYDKKSDGLYRSISILICQIMICPIFIFCGKLNLKVCIVTPKHVIDGTAWFFGYNKVFSSTLWLC